MKNKIYAILLLSVVSLVIAGCSAGASAEKKIKRETIFIGIDTSGSFTKRAYYEDSIKFIAYYIYGHINGAGGLKQPKALFVAEIGGFSANEPKSFRPLEDFESKSAEQIEADLKSWLVPKQSVTDFNAFFEKVKSLIQMKNLVLAPIDIVIVTDGEPEILNKSGKVVPQAVKDVDLSSMEYLSRNITLRLLYPTPVMAGRWEKETKSKRLRILPVDNEVMNGWKEKVKLGVPAEDQAELWKWITSIVDYRIRRKVF